MLVAKLGILYVVGVMLLLVLGELLESCTDFQTLARPQPLVVDGSSTSDEKHDPPPLLAQGGSRVDGRAGAPDARPSPSGGSGGVSFGYDGSAPDSEREPAEASPDDAPGTPPETGAGGAQDGSGGTSATGGAGSPWAGGAPSCGPFCASCPAPMLPCCAGAACGCLWQTSQGERCCPGASLCP